MSVGCEGNQGAASLKEGDFAWSLCTNFLFQCVGKVLLDAWHHDRRFAEHYSVSG